MSKPHPSYSIKECKILASLLLKAIRSANPDAALKAAKRIKRLPEFNDMSLENILAFEVKRKHALAAIALEKGFQSWADLKCQLPFIKGGFLNHWFANYADAKAKQQADGGYLLPYQNQFIVCDQDYIVNLGFDISDPDWKMIGYDWARPSNQVAWKRLYRKWMKIMEVNNA